MGINRRAVSIQAQGNYRKITIARFAGHITLVQELDVPVKESARGLQVVRIGIDDGEMRGWKKFSKDHRCPRKETAAHNGDAANAPQLREQSLKCPPMSSQDEALQPRRTQYQALKDL